MLNMLMEIVLVTYITFVSVILLLLVWAVYIINKKKMSRDLQKNKKESSLLSIKQASAAPKQGRKRATGHKAQTKRHILTSN